jgi:asparagine N-glycosylation enzyme membrane subunit Stt3
MTMRRVTAAAVLISVAIHLSLWFQGMRDVHVIGPLFLVNIVAGTAIAVLLVTWRHWLPPGLAACFGLATFGAFTLASTVGLYGDHESWTGFSVFAAATAEIVAVVLGVTLVLEEPDEDVLLAPADRARSAQGRSSGTSS